MCFLFCFWVYICVFRVSWYFWNDCELHIRQISLCCFSSKTIFDSCCNCCVNTRSPHNCTSFALWDPARRCNEDMKLVTCCEQRSIAPPKLHCSTENLNQTWGECFTAYQLGYPGDLMDLFDILFVAASKTICFFKLNPAAFLVQSASFRLLQKKTRPVWQRFDFCFF